MERARIVEPALAVAERSQVGEALGDLGMTLAKLGLSPSEISEGEIHSSFTVRDPSGHVVKFNSTHVSDQPV